MRRTRVHHLPLPGAGQLVELPAAPGPPASVASCRSGRDLSIGSPDGDRPDVAVALTRPEATAHAPPLVRDHSQLVTDRRG